MQPFLDSKNVIENSAELARRLQRDGYLFISSLLPSKPLEELRLKNLQVARNAGWIQSETPLNEAVAELDSFCVEPEPTYMKQYQEMYCLPEFHALQHRRELVDLLQNILGETVLPHPRIIGRTIFPSFEAYTTPPHQDFIPIQGTPDTYTAWIPLSDLPPEMGGLQIASGSHRKGVYDFKPAMGAGGLEVTDPLDGTWVTNPFSQGDVLFFHSMVVHKGVPNRSNKLRMSIDARYQKVSDPIAPGSLEPHTKPQTWENIYARWHKRSYLNYYWKKWDLQMVDYDDSYHEKRDAMAFKMAENGDPVARSALQRIIARDKNPGKRQRAQKLLKVMDTN
ncbi:MAG: 1-deoxypentalenic acid 11-beta-hydroxylase [Candidatus Moanabacter tarae]|uniref:1-deoxypentalenic acid 11-beta-hydroxylase n=1 Tax=Candidatus Moanibacter tarae TaxID=2200854 RepID=A0A2Z4AE56_9BACT|nr:MAG: 1-deoxypentalenic acid 11-beta-hydroxylase [Candidatus Moanabacter tarae]|tara:strand:+ start:62459 stop:63469 length:1011 start_codon:yes stop_codon:yes gene_type:complete